MRTYIVRYITMPIVWILFSASALALFFVDLAVWLLTFWWDKRLWVLHRYSIVWSMFYIWINPFWRIQFEGKTNIRKGQPYIIVSNHQSSFDIVLLYRLWMHFKWVAKRELFRVPVIGWNLWLNKHIAIDRSSISGAKKLITQAQANLNMGNSVLIFPEGTRSLDGAIKRFKDGAFVLAKRSNFPILPVVIDGSIDVLPRKGYVVKGSQLFKIRVLPEISPEVYKDMSADELAQEVNRIMVENHREMAPKFYS